MSDYNLALPFWQASRKHPDRLALAVESEWSYARAAAQASAIAAWLGPGGRRVAILGSRSAAAALATLGACWRGVTYIPLSLRWPEARLLEVLQRIQVDALLVDDRGQALLTPGVRARVPRILHPLRELREAPPARAPVPGAASDLAYILFTSGTTGVPKGVMVRLAAVDHLLRASHQLFPLQPEDRLAGNFELSFDGCVFDMFLSWRAGASFHWVPPDQAMAPLAFLRRRRATIALLTPSTLPLMRSLRALQPGALPDLRWSLFGAEALPGDDALEWQQVAPASQLFSLYGPTENTVTSMVQPLGPITPERGTLPLGRPLEGLSALVVDENLQQLGPGKVGQLVLRGPQLAQGYLDDPELTARRFPVLSGERSYLSGDLAYQDESGVFHHLGRMDHQVKVRGHRLELEEVEAALRTASGDSRVAALLWPDVPGQLGEVIAFLGGSGLNLAEIQKSLKADLPQYALPSRIYELETLPLSENGKIDRAALRAWLGATAG